ncbi:hypothetical protein [Actinomadura roseirufa]|nr:hypothetical protein [Actinomadura roseirufa]
MIPTQPKKWPQALVTVCVALFVIKNPVAAAHGVQAVTSALSSFVDAF